MIDTEKYMQIFRLLQMEGLSHRTIARLTGVSRGTVGAVAKRRIRNLAVKEIQLNPKGPLVRCPTCGGKTQMPCTYCALEKSIGIRTKGVKWDFSKNDTGLFNIDLRGWALKRYLQVRRWREEQLDPNFDEIPESWPWKNKVKEND